MPIIQDTFTIVIITKSMKVNAKEIPTKLDTGQRPAAPSTLGYTTSLPRKINSGVRIPQSYKTSHVIETRNTYYEKLK